MHTLILTLAIALTFLAGCQSNQHMADDASGATHVAAPTGMLRHVVQFKFNEDVTDEQIAEVEREFAALPDRIDTIRGFEYGHTDISMENLNKGFTHCFIVTFDDMAGLEVYGPHPAHQEFVALIGPLLDEAFVVDYYVRDSAPE
ncbi:MAG: Dabb family protein [Phycisphaeraceae bacterium]